MTLDPKQTVGGDAWNIWERFASANGLPRIGDPHSSVTPFDVVYAEHSFEVRRYRSERPLTQAQPIVVCFSLINRPYILDLQPDRSVMAQLLRLGGDVYLIDWSTPSSSDCGLRLEDYVCRFIKSAVDVVCQQSKSSQVNLLGYCMGGTMTAMYTALHQDTVRNLILLATPIDFSGDSLLNLWTREEYFNVDGLIDAFGNCPGSLLQMCFQLMRPVQNYVEKYMKLCERRDDDAFLQNFLAMERWANDNVPVAGETFRDFVKLLYQRNQLVNGEMCFQGNKVDLERITCPLLMLTADSDHLVPPASTLVLQDHVSSDDVTAMSVNVGHIGLAVSSKAHRDLWPAAATWIADRSTFGN
jgi:polyhydroxyalkanoate synthase